MKIRKLRRLLWAALAGGALVSGHSALADTAAEIHEHRTEKRALLAQIRTVEFDLHALEDRLAAALKIRAKLDAQTRARLTQDECGGCRALRAAACASPDSSPNSSPNSSDDCYALYRDHSCYEERLTASQRGLVDRCWRVQRDRDLARVSDEVSSLQTGIGQQKLALKSLWGDLAGEFERHPIRCVRVAQRSLP